MKYLVKYSYVTDVAVKDWVAKTQAYWQRQEFKCEEVNEGEVVKVTGSRGSMAGNFGSFDMKKLICGLEVCRSSDGKVEVSLLVNGILQDITDINLWDFKLELILYERYVNDVAEPVFMREYIAARNRGSILWSISLFILGRRLSKKMRTRLEELCGDNELPTVERRR